MRTRFFLSMLFGLLTPLAACASSSGGPGVGGAGSGGAVASSSSAGGSVPLGCVAQPCAPSPNPCHLPTCEADGTCTYTAPQRAGVTCAPQAVCNDMGQCTAAGPSCKADADCDSGVCYELSSTCSPTGPTVGDAG
jgi:hypothetical protein